MSSLPRLNQPDNRTPSSSVAQTGYGLYQLLIPLAPDASLQNTAEAPITLDLDRLSLAARSVAANTWRAFQADLKVYGAWCQSNLRLGLPASRTTVHLFVRDMVHNGRALSTVERYLSSIARVHRLLDLADPTKTDLVKSEVRALKREHGTTRRQARGLRFKGQVRSLDHTPAGISIAAILQAQPAGIQADRDKALLLTAYSTGCRRSELVGLGFEHIERWADGAGIAFIPTSKTDQLSEGKKVYLSPAALRAVDDWVVAAGDIGIAPTISVTSTKSDARHSMPIPCPLSSSEWFAGQQMPALFRTWPTAIFRTGSPAFQVTR